MFWADKIAQELKKRKLPLEWVDDMKTPSGKIHVGALRGVVIHDLVYKSLKDAGIKTKYTYIFDNHDPMDALPVYLSKEKYEKYLGMPLFKVPSPISGFDNYAEYYALDFKKVFNAIGCNPEIIWAADLYLSGKMNKVIKECLDKAEVIRGIYKGLYKKEIPKDWYPFQIYCPQCGKVSTTRVTNWDGKEVTFICDIERLDWTKGCGLTGAVSPFSTNEKIAGKLSWKIEWPAKWKALGITVEGAGKDHMSKGGSHDVASLVCEKVLHYLTPYPVSYEFFLIGGKKMSSSKGRGSSSSEMLEILPPELLRFLMIKTKISQQINFDTSGDTIPNLFDEYQKSAQAYFDKKENDDLARVFELSQVGEIKNPPEIRFSVLAQWVQMPNMEEEIKKQGLTEWAKYARVWVEKFAPESEKFTVQKIIPKEAEKLSENQKKFLRRVASELDKNWNAEAFQKNIYELTKELGLPSKEAFSAIYMALIGKDHGPKAGWLILSLDKDFVKKRFEKISENYPKKLEEKNDVKKLSNPKIFSIDQKLKEKFPSISVGVAIIKGVTIKKSDHSLEGKKNEILKSLENLTTEQLGEYDEIKSYRRLYKETGVDWHSKRPSPEALLRRIALKKGLYTVNTCVDVYNLVVMKYRVSIGAFDLDQINFPTVLRFAKEGEEIFLLGDKEITKYKEGEIAYFDQKGGFNTDFNYRDSQRTAVQLSTKNLYINVDGVYSITPEKVREVLKEACDGIIECCGGEIELLGVEAAS
ncbi:MAG: lysine--tRNA ligase [bacterium]|nr:lysine--tRNA ligase [bacterium]